MVKGVYLVNFQTPFDSLLVVVGALDEPLKHLRVIWMWSSIACQGVCVCVCALARKRERGDSLGLGSGGWSDWVERGGPGGGLNLLW